MDAQLVGLANCFKATVSTDGHVRKQAEAQLKAQERQQGFAIALLKLIKHFSGLLATDRSANQICVSAAIYFKRTIEQGWNESDEDAGIAGGNKENRIHPQERELIKQNLVDFMCAVPERVQMQFSDAIEVISRKEFPDRWKTLLPKLVSRIDMKNLVTTIAVLKTAHAIFKRFRGVAKTDANLYPLKIALEQFQVPMLQAFSALCVLLKQHGENAAQRKNVERVYVAMTLIVKMMYSLCWIDLPEYFEDHMKDYFSVFHEFLNHKNRLIEGDADEYSPTLGDKLKKNVVKVLNLFAGKYEEEFTPHFQTFATDIWNILKASSPAPRHDKLVTASMQFLSSVVQRNLHRKVFDSAGALGSLIREVVVPNLNLREHDEETFEDNPLEYIRTDIEGSDANTRRRAASDLVRALLVLFANKITPMCLQCADAMLQEYQRDPRGKWKRKDAALNLILAVSVRTQTTQHGARELNTGVNVMRYFPQHVIAELQTDASPPVIRADAIKFVTVFRQHMNKDMLKSIFPLMLKHLSAKSVVVHTYAANWVERVLVVKDRGAGSGGGVTTKLRLGREALKPFLQPLLVNLFGLLERPNYMTSAGSAPDYIMKCIMRVVGVAKEDVMPYLGVVLEKLKALLAHAAKNPSNPKYNHFMFEAVAALVRNVAGKNRATVANFQHSLFPVFNEILAKEVAEFMPYALQIMAQLLRLSPNGITKPFQALFGRILVPAQYKNRGNVPALVELLQAYLVAPGDGPNSTRAVVVPKLEAVLGVWQSLCCKRSTELQALRMLEVIVDHLPLALYGKYLGTIFTSLVQRLLKVKGPRFKMLFVPTFCRVVAKIGGTPVAAAVESLQAGMFATLMRQVVLPHVCKVTGDVDRKNCAVGLARLLGDTNFFARDPQLCRDCVAGVVLFYQSKDPREKVKDDAHADVQAGIQEIEYNSMASYSRLNFSGSSGKGRDAFPEIKNPLDYLRQQLGALNAKSPGVVSGSSGETVKALGAMGIRM